MTGLIVNIILTYQDYVTNITQSQQRIKIHGHQVEDHRQHTTISQCTLTTTEHPAQQALERFQFGFIPNLPRDKPVPAG